jgi:acetyl-CoA carboxylase biotin carboxyl carrier protein
MKPSSSSKKGAAKDASSEPQAPDQVTRQIDQLGEILRRHDLSEIEWREEGGRTITLRRQREVIAAAPAQVFAPAPAHVQAASPAAAPLPAPVAPTPKAETSDGNVSYITSPFVGTFYRSPGPDSAPFVDNGTRVRKGQVICIVEAMKLMNEIESEIDGVIVQCLVENGSAVEYGEPLFKIKQG